MNELDFLAWLILGVFLVFGVLPFLVGGRGSSYLDRLVFIMYFAVIFGGFILVFGSLIWAATRVLG